MQRFHYSVKNFLALISGNQTLPEDLQAQKSANIDKICKI